MDTGKQSSRGDHTNERKLYQTRFAEICEVFFFLKDENAEAVLLAVEHAQYDPRTKNTSIAVENASPEVADLLEHIGVENGIMIFPEDLVRYNAIKNNMRRQFHDQTELNLNDELETSILRRQSQMKNTNLSEAYESDISQSDGGMSRDISRRVDRLKRFSVEHRINVGSHPFILGLRLAFATQSGCPTVLRWRLADAVLTQAGVPFMNSAVELLLEVLLFTSDSKDMPPKGDRDWFVCAWFSDKDLRELLQALPLADSLEGRATGVLTETERGRIYTEQDTLSVTEDVQQRLLYVKSTIFSCFSTPFRACKLC
eukprot:CFRG5577T1